MDLLHIFTSGLLMKAVNILGDNAIQLPILLHLRQFQVSRIRLHIPDIKILAEVIKEHLRLPVKALITEQIFRAVPGKLLIRLAVQPILAPEVRNPTLRRNSGSAKEHYTR